MRVGTYCANFLMGVDQFASTILGGMPGETLSGRTGGALVEGKLRGKIFAPPIDAFMHICRQYPTWRGHCVHAIGGDTGRALAIVKDEARLNALVARYVKAHQNEF